MASYGHGKLDSKYQTGHPTMTSLLGPIRKREQKWKIVNI